MPPLGNIFERFPDTIDIDPAADGKASRIRRQLVRHDIEWKIKKSFYEPLYREGTSRRRYTSLGKLCDTDNSKVRVERVLAGQVRWA